MSRTRAARCLSIVATSLTFAALITACGDGKDSGSSSSGKDIVIGMVEDTSGGTAATSAEASTGISLAIDEINKAGGVGGRSLKLIRQSDGSQPSQTPAVVRKLVSDGARVIIMNSSSASAQQVKPVVEQEKIVAVSATNIATAIAEPPNNTFSFILANPITDIGTVYAAAFKKTGVTKLAVITDDSPTMAGLNKGLLPIFEQSGITIVANEKAPLNSTDVAPQLSRIAGAKPDALFVSSLGGQLEVLFHNTAHQIMPDTPRISLASIGNQPETWKLAKPGALRQLVYASAISADNERSTELGGKLKAKLGEKYLGLTAFAAQGYDTVYLLKQAIEKAGVDSSPAQVRDGLEQISKFPASWGRQGFTMSFTSSKHVGSDGLCGIVLRRFTEQNQPGDNWADYQPQCS
ncbi:ABC transporter substrate-binding protein [Dactylosporangium sucinum]|uniref:ABC transporter substrate-binding protein n=1 Tax=Dactylosporangium TaxID=35753 RepID=UPI00167CB41A|nr:MULTISPECIES: ABC transporter substrate-binding protein [Dactylosporangium]WVK86571.1 ABC transporter substrate-binding protein [Dactylosporangium sp. AC04546]